jgi:hypothetical protein
MILHHTAASHFLSLATAGTGIRKVEEACGEGRLDNAEQ